jgi:hypothetical protein
VFSRTAEFNEKPDAVAAEQLTFIAALVRCLCNIVVRVPVVLTVVHLHRWRHFFFYYVCFF